MGNLKNPIIYIPLILTVVLIVILGIFFAAKKSNPKPEKIVEEPPKITAEGSFKGVNYLPRGESLADRDDFFEKSRQAGQIITWAGDWLELSKQKGGPYSIAELARNRGFEPVIIASAYDQGRKQPLRPTDEKTKKEYRDGGAKFAEKYKPTYMGFGVEINVMYENHPTEFERFVETFDQTITAVKAKSPGTKVFTVFQLERIKGLKGGLFGGANNTAKNDWQLLNRFQKADIFAFTTYPELIYKDPSEIPADYYLEIKQHTSKQVAFTEVAWPANLTVKGWESTEEEQAAFIQRFFDLTRDLEPEMIVWPFIYDPPVNEPFSSIGLVKKGGTPKAAWNTWVNAK